MVTPLVNQYTPVAVTRQSVGTTLSVLPDATALDAAPANGGALMAGLDRTNSLQRHVSVDASGRLIVVTGAAGATAAFDSGAVDETLTTDTVRAAVTARDQSQGATTQNNPIEGRGALAAQAYTLNRLFVDSVTRGDDGATYSAVKARTDAAFSGLIGTSDVGLHVLSSTYGFDLGSNVFRLISTRNGLAAIAYTDQRLGVDATLRADDGATYSVPGTRAALAAQAYTIQRLAVDGVVRGDDGATYSAVATRAALAAQANTLQRLLCDVTLRGQDVAGTTWSALNSDLASAISGRLPTATEALYAAAIATGIDNTGAAVLRPVEARSVSNWNGGLNTLIELGVASNVFGQSGAGSTLQQVFAEVGNAISGRTTSSVAGLYSAAILTGTDTTGAAVLRPVEARGALAAQAYSLFRLFSDSVIRADDGATYTAASIRGSVGTLGQTLNRLLVDSRTRLNDTINAVDAVAQGVDELKNSGNVHQVVLQGRGRAFHSSLRGRRFTITGANFATITGTTSFTAATPNFLLVTGASKSLIIHRLTVTKTVVGTSTSFQVLVKIDTANRFTSGGTARTAQNMNTTGAVATALATVVDSASAITATAEGGGTRLIGQQAGSVIAGSKIEYLWESGLIVGPSASFLFYILNGTAGDTCSYEIEAEEAQVE